MSLTYFASTNSDEKNQSSAVWYWDRLLGNHPNKKIKSIPKRINEIVGWYFGQVSVDQSRSSLHFEFPLENEEWKGFKLLKLKYENLAVVFTFRSWVRMQYHILHNIICDCQTFKMQHHNYFGNFLSLLFSFLAN